MQEKPKLMASRQTQRPTAGSSSVECATGGSVQGGEGTRVYGKRMGPDSRKTVVHTLLLGHRCMVCGHAELSDMPVLPVMSRWW